MRGADARPIIPLRETPDVKRGAHTPPISSGTATTIVRAGTGRAVDSVATRWHSTHESAIARTRCWCRREHSMKLKPLGDRLIVRAVEEDETTVSGIVLPDTAKEKPQKGEVLAVGDGKLSEETGKRIPLDVAEGDEVLYSKYGGTEIKVDGEDLLVLRESDVLAKVL
jgi:chaperonin GroES